MNDRRTSNANPAASARVKAEAADWLARRERGLTAEEEKQFENWVSADPRHASAARDTRRAWTYLRRPQFTGQSGEVIERIERRVKAQRRRRTWQAGLAGLAAALVVLAFVSPRSAAPVATDDGEARVAVRPEQQTLDDGSIVELNAGAEVAIEFTPGRRAVRLVRGEAHFAVAKDASRPFVVSAGAVAVRAIGTEFAVRFDPASVDVLVTEGQVAVERVAAVQAETEESLRALSAVLAAGNRTVVHIAAPTIAPIEIQPVDPAEIASALAWRTLRVEFTAMPLGDVVERFNRRNPTKLELADSELGELRISGVFWLDDPEGFSRLVAASAGLRAGRSAPERILLSRP